MKIPSSLEATLQYLPAIAAVFLLTVFPSSTRASGDDARAASGPQVLALTHQASSQYAQNPLAIPNKASGMCLDVAEDRPSGRVVIAPCGTTDERPFQAWREVGNKLLNVRSDLCLDVGGAAGDAAILNPCETGQATGTQAWEALASGYRNVSTGKCLDVRENRAGGSVVVAPCGGEADRPFQIWNQWPEARTVTAPTPPAGGTSQGTPDPGTPAPSSADPSPETVTPRPAPPAGALAYPERRADDYPTDTRANDPALRHGDKFLLKSVFTDRYLGQYYVGNSYYYPVMREDVGTAETLTLAKLGIFEGAPAMNLAAVTTIMITANDQAWQSDWRGYNFLGTFRDGVYYYTDDGYQTNTNWNVEGKLEYGETIRLMNVEWSQYLSPGSSDLASLTTVSDRQGDTTLWRVERPAAADRFHFVDEDSQPGSYMTRRAEPEGWVVAATRDWMAKLPDSRKVSRLSIPGTHDSTARYGWEHCITQSWTISAQLAAGIRYFDLRISPHTDNKFYMYHGSCYQHMTLDDVLEEMETFLADHPGEGLIVRIQEANRTPSSGSPSVATLWPYYMTEWGHLFVRGQTSPTLGQIRGRIFTIRAAGAEDISSDYGPEMKQVIRHNRYNIGLSPSAENEKYDKILDYLNIAIRGSNALVLNDINATGAGTPWIYAPSFNDWLYRTIEHDPSAGWRSLGILAMDYPGEKLIYRIVKNNF